MGGNSIQITRKNVLASTSPFVIAALQEKRLFCGFVKDGPKSDLTGSNKFLDCRQLKIWIDLTGHPMVP